MSYHKSRLMACSLCHLHPPKEPVVLDCTHVLCESCALSILSNSSAVWGVSKDHYLIGQCPQCKSLFIEPAMLYLSGTQQGKSPDLELWRQLFTPNH